MAPAANLPFRFLDLPNELQDRVYACLFEKHVIRVTVVDTATTTSILEALDEDRAITGQEDAESHKKACISRNDAQGILLTCRKCYNDGIDRYWRNLTLRFGSTEDYRSIALSMPDHWYDKLARIRHVEFASQQEIISPLNFVAFEKLRDIHFLADATTETKALHNVYFGRDTETWIALTDEQLINYISNRPVAKRWVAAKNLCPQRQVDIFMACRLVICFLKAHPSIYDRYIEVPVCVDFARMKLIDTYRGTEKRHVGWTLAVTSLTAVRQPGMAYTCLVKCDEKHPISGDHCDGSILQVLGLAGSAVRGLEWPSPGDH